MDQNTAIKFTSRASVPEIISNCVHFHRPFCLLFDWIQWVFAFRLTACSIWTYFRPFTFHSDSGRLKSLSLERIMFRVYNFKPSLRLVYAGWIQFRDGKKTMWLCAKSGKRQLSWKSNFSPSTLDPKACGWWVVKQDKRWIGCSANQTTEDPLETETKQPLRPEGAVPSGSWLSCWSVLPDGSVQIDGRW